MRRLPPNVTLLLINEPGTPRGEIGTIVSVSAESAQRAGRLSLQNHLFFYHCWLVFEGP